jgi:hypothetical protein
VFRDSIEMRELKLSRLTVLIGGLTNGDTPTHAILCKSLRNRWFLALACPSRETAEQEAAQKQELRRTARVEYVIAQCDST